MAGGAMCNQNPKDRNVQADVGLFFFFRAIRNFTWNFVAKFRIACDATLLNSCTVSFSGDLSSRRSTYFQQKNLQKWLHSGYFLFTQKKALATRTPRGVRVVNLKFDQIWTDLGFKNWKLVEIVILLDKSPENETSETG